MKFLHYILVVSLLEYVTAASNETFFGGRFLMKDKPDNSYWELLEKVGVSAGVLENMKETQNIEVNIIPSPPSYMFQLDIGGYFRRHLLEPMKEVDDVFLNGVKSKLMLKVKGNKMKFTRTFPDFKIETTAKFSKEGIDVKITAKKNLKTKLKLKRIGWGDE